MHVLDHAHEAVPLPPNAKDSEIVLVSHRSIMSWFDYARAVISSLATDRVNHPAVQVLPSTLEPIAQ